MSLSPPESYRFDEFELHPGRRSLTRNGEKIFIAPKAFEVLTCLVANAGAVVTKGDLIKTVWPGAFVEEANLTQHIFALGKALGDRSSLIATLPGRGYQLTAPVHPINPPSPHLSGARSIGPPPPSASFSAASSAGAAAIASTALSSRETTMNLFTH
jgi:DNA-binding winged helix-turn-helix (wHTH) protein